MRGSEERHSKQEFSRFSRLRNGWTPPPELSGSEPRPVRFTGRGASILVLSLIFVSGGTATLVGLTLKWQHEQDLANRMTAEGREAEGSVTRRWYTRGGKFSYYYLTYEFIAGGSKYKGDSRVSYGYWKSMKVGSSLPIRYLPSDPHHNYADKQPPLITSLWLAILIGGIFLVPGSLMFFRVRRQWRLMKHGQPAPAVVTDNRSVRGRFREVNVLNYEFPLAPGGTAKNRWSTVELYAAKGSVITIVYDPKKPRRSSPYPIPNPVLVRLASAN